MCRLKHFCLVIVLFCSGCVCVFAPCERRLHVSGQVSDADHNRVAYATVVLNGVRKETDERGCFYFGGLAAATDFDMTVTKVGYKPYHGVKEFDYFETIVTLSSENSEQQSSAIWTKLGVDEISKYKGCGEK
jgi:Carboxypeptidase regulatory-like domain